MSMLAERRRKQKWSLNPRGKDWSEDSNKFGQKLLEKMGWSSGKGLGAKENGITEHIKVSYKNDSRGMGFKESDDQWTQHESKFSQLLSSLSGGKEDSNTGQDGELKLESLETKSQKSRARVHYHKFTRGKDLSRYSEKDLANIFGKKTLKEKKEPEITVKAQNVNEEDSENKNFGVQTHNAGSMLDYFKKKMSNNKKYTVNDEAKTVDGNNSDSENERPSFGFGFSLGGNDNKVQSSFVSYIKESETASSENIIEEQVQVKKKKKSKKNVMFNSINENINGSSSEALQEESSPSNIQERNSEKELEIAFTPLKKKFKNFESLNSLQDEEKIEHTPTKKCKKKKKSKRKYENDNDEEDKSKKRKVETNGLTNPAFDPMFSQVCVEKHSLAVINEAEEESLQEDSFQESTENRQIKILQDISISVPKTKSMKMKKSEKNKGIENECFKDFPEAEASPETNQICTVASNNEGKKKSKKSKKEKKQDEPGIENSAFSDSVILDESLENFETKRVEENYEVVTKKRMKKRKLEEEGITNPCFEDNIVPGELKKKKKDKRNKDIQLDSQNMEESPEILQDSQDFCENASAPKRRKKDHLVPAENAAFNPNDSSEIQEINTTLYEVKRKNNNANLGIENPGLDLTSPSPKKDAKKVKKKETIPQELEMPVMDDEVMLNVVSTPVPKKEGEKSSKKTVRFSGVNHRKNGQNGVENKAYDEFGNQIEENIDTLSKQLDDYQAEVENDINEAKMEVMVGEMGNPDGENEILPNGDAKLKFKYAYFGRLPPWMRRKGEANAKTSYRHLIKGDIVLGFKNTNLHEIKGYVKPVQVSDK